MRFLTTTLTLFLAICANAQWTVVNLHPAGVEWSLAAGVEGDQQVGYGNPYSAGYERAFLWSGDEWVNLHPAHHPEGSLWSYASAVQGGQQVGWAAIGNYEIHASLWTGTAESWVSLKPLEFTQSSALGVYNGTQVGTCGFYGTPTRACLWRGTAESYVDLHPPGASGSGTTAVDETQQVGVATVGGVEHASLWTGTAASWVDLHPAGASQSDARGVHDGQQVGWARVGSADRASLWSGTAASWVNLHPAGAFRSTAYGVSSGRQVGFAWVGGMNRASLWYGSAGSWTDLSAFLPGGYTVSEARGIWVGASGLTRVVGFAHNVTTGLVEAMMWVSRAVAPTSFGMLRGTVFSGSLASLINSDGNKLVLRPGVVLTSGEPPVQVRINSTAPSANPDGISFSVESSASFAFAQQKVSLWNYDTGAYELLDTRVVTTSDNTLTITVRTNAQRFIDNGTLAMRALVSYKAIGPSILSPWSARIDKVWWTFPG